MPVPAIPGVPPFATHDDLVKSVTKIRGELVNLLLNLDSLNVVSLTADNVDTGTLNAGKVTIRSDLTGDAYIQIDGNGMVINNGLLDTFKADIDGAVTMTSATIQNDLTGSGSVTINNSGIVVNDGIDDTFVVDSDGQVTMTGATVQSKSGSYPLVVMDPGDDFIAAYQDANNYVGMFSTFGGGAPALAAVVNSIDAYQLSASDTQVVLNASAKELLLTTDIQGDINLNPAIGYSVLVPGWDVFRQSGGTGSDLSTELFTLETSISDLTTTVSGKATAGASTSTDGATSLNGGIPVGTQLAVNGGGFVTWAGITVPSHSHTQT